MKRFPWWRISKRTSFCGWTIQHSHGSRLPTPGGSTLRTVFILFLPPLPSLPPSQGPTAKKMVERTPTQRKKQGWVVRKVGLQANDGPGPSKQKEVSLSWGLPLQFCALWPSFPVESRSGPPSPDSPSETSFSAALAPVWVKVSRRLEAPRRPSNWETSPLWLEAGWTQTCLTVSLGTHTSAKKSPQFPPSTRPVERERGTGESWQWSSNQHDSGSIQRVMLDAYRKGGVWSHEKEWNKAICSNTDGPRESHQVK